MKREPGRSGVEDELGDLAALHARAVGAVRRALELHGDLAALHLRHALLPEVAELVAVQDDAGRVECVRLDLHRVLEPHGERAARAVREVLAEVLPRTTPCRLSSILALYSAEPQLEPYSPKPAMKTLLSTANWMLSQRPR